MHLTPATPVRLRAGTLVLRPWAPEDVAVLAELYQDEALRRWAAAPVHDEPSAARWVAEQQRGWETGERLAFAVQETRASDARPAGNVVLKRPAVEKSGRHAGPLGAVPGEDEHRARPRTGGPADHVPGGLVVGEQRQAAHQRLPVGGDDRAPMVEQRPVADQRPATPSSFAEVGYWTAAHARGRGVAPRALTALADWAFDAFAHQGLTRLELLHQVDNTASCRVAEKSGFALSGVLPAAPPAFPLDGHRHIRRAPAAG